MPLDLSTLRQNYAMNALSEKEVSADPFLQFKKWFQEAIDSQLLEPNAFSLGTATAKGKPSVRTVLLKGVEAGSFVFFTNYESRKGTELQDNPQAAMLFTWLDLQRQIRIEGSIEKVSQEESEAYFQSRPRESQIGAWASPQSSPIQDRVLLEKNQEEVIARFKNVDKLPVPPFWGGYRIIPNWFEFWQGRQSRLHDRVVYFKDGDSWKLGRLAP